MTSTTTTTGARLTSADLVLLRQALPTFLKSDGTMSSQLFAPSSADKDDRLLVSTLHGRVDPEEAHRRHTAAGHESLGTWGASVGEIEAEGLQSYDDGGLGGNPPDHASIDMTPVTSRKDRQRRAGNLRDKAVARGVLFDPSAS